MEGKISLGNLQNILRKELLGKKSIGVILGPLIGTDAAVFDFEKAKEIALNYYELQNEECALVWKSDPITFPTPNPGKYALIINANDLTCLGAIPYAVLVTWLLPPEFKQSYMEKLQSELHQAAKEQNIVILGGHSEFTSAVNSPVVSLSMIGFTPKSYLPSRKINVGDHLYLLGFVGNEGTAILGHEAQNKKTLPDNIKNQLIYLKIFDQNLSIATDGLFINKNLKPPLIHDGTEGGILGAIYEMFVELDVSVTIKSNALLKQTHKLTKDICEWLNINPLRLIASGTLLICTKKEIQFEIIQQIKHPIRKIGVITSNKDFLLDNEKFGPPEPDQVILGLERLSKIE
ncbi:MAG: AIR synthase related protein [Candidatus Hodarchaeales archaeon]|jgi:hydrogenase expression/formation protein HypE